MKTAKEWWKHTDEILTEDEYLAWIKNIQRDALSDAGMICTRHGDKWRSGTSEGCSGGWTVKASDECASLIGEAIKSIV